MKRKHSRPGVEIGSACSFPTTLTITSQALEVLVQLYGCTTSDVLLWTLIHGHINVGRPVKTYTHQFCVDTGCRLDSFPRAMVDRESKESVLLACLDEDDEDDELYSWQIRGCPRGVMVKAMDCGIVVRDFVLQSRYYVHFRANTLGKGMNPLILRTMG